MKGLGFIMASSGRRMKISCLLCLVVTLLSVASCSRGPMTHKAVRKAAESYYAMLIKGNYKGFVQGYADSKGLPEDYLSQLVDATAQFMSEGNMPNLTSAKAVGDSIAEDSTAYVTLRLGFADSTSELIGLPLTLREGRWKMRTP